MFQNATISMLSTFKKGDWEDFLVFLKSPFFKAKKNEILLFEALKRGEKAKSSHRGQGEKNEIFGQVFPGQAFDDHKLNKVFSVLNEHLRLFWACNRLRDDKSLQFEALSRFHFGRSATEVYKKSVADALKELEAAPESANLYLERLRLKKKQLDVERNALRIELGKSEVEGLLERHYWLVKVQFACFELSRGSNLGQDGKNKAPNQQKDKLMCQSLLEQAMLFEKESLLLQLYNALLKMLLVETPVLRDFENFMERLSKVSAQSIERQELESVVRHFQNILVLGAASQPSAYDLLYTLYDWAFKSNVWGQNLPLTNVVLILSKNKRQAKAEDLIAQYRAKVVHQDNSPKELCLAEGILLFYRAKYTACLKVLEDVTHLQDERLILQAHTVRVRAAYELSVANPKDDSLESALEKHIGAFERYLERANDIPKQRIRENQAFADVLREMVWPQNTPPLKDMLQKKQPAMRDWLQPHLDRLSKE